MLSITLVPAITLLLIRGERFNFRPRLLCRITNALLVGKIRKEESHPISRLLRKLYRPVVNSVLRHRRATIIAALLIVLLTVPVYFRLGAEFMPPLDEGVLLYMPTTLPGISVTEAQRFLQVQDKVIKSFPEVERVFGKAGRAETATDPAPFSMMETVIVLKPQSEWPKRHRWYSSWAPAWLQSILRQGWPDHKSTQELIYGPGGFNEAMELPGVVNAWTMPIKARGDMLTTGVRTPVGIKVLGADLNQIQDIGQHIEMALRDVPGTTSVFAERTAGGYFLDFDLKREELARYGLTIDMANMVIMSAVGGENITTTVEGRERYPVNVRYMRDWRSTVDRLNRTLVSAMGGAQIPIAQIADVKLLSGPGMIRDENGRLSGYFNTRSVTKTMIVFLSLPFSAVGAIWLLYLLGYNLSIAVWVELIALMGVAAEMGVFVLLYQDLSYEEMRANGLMKTREQLREAIVNGTVMRLRPMFMTVAVDFIGLIPVMLAAGTGADLTKRIAAPLVAGMFTSFVMGLVVYPAIYSVWKWHTEVKNRRRCREEACLAKKHF